MLPVRMFPRWGATSCATAKEWNGAVESEENGTVESESVAIAEEKSLAGSARAAAGKKSFANFAGSAGGGGGRGSVNRGVWGLWGMPSNQETTGSEAQTSGARWAEHAA